LHLDEIVRLENNIVEILYKLERAFPLAFFNVIEHLIVHLPHELKVGGRVQYRRMNDYERYDMIHRNHVSSVVHKWHWISLDYRFLHHLKWKVSNKARVEPSICYAYLMEEITNFIVDVKARDLSRNVIRIEQDKFNVNLPGIFSWNIGYTLTMALCGSWII